MAQDPPVPRGPEAESGTLSSSPSASRTSPGRTPTDQTSTAPDSRPTTILAVGFSHEEFLRCIAPFDPAWDVDRFPGGRGALDLLRPCSIDLVVLSHPLPDLALADFLLALREPRTASRHCGLVAVSERKNAAEALRFVGRGINRVISKKKAPRLLAPTVKALLRVAPRRPSTVPTRLELPHLGSFEAVARNTSATGLLVETGQRPPKGTELGFELELPSERAPVFGRARVVRHTVPERERVSGLGMRIVAFSGQAAGRAYSDFLKS
ncbi:MAG: PilZ domain-containing protein [Acidobacteriota bacterium]